MNFSQFLTLSFFVLIIAKLLVQIFLNLRNQNYIKHHCSMVPVDFKDKISLEEHQKAATYSVAKTKWALMTLFIETIMLIVWLPLGLSEFLDQLISQSISSEISRGMIFFASFFVINFIISIPEKLYETFVLEEKFGFNKTTVKTFYTDLLKQLALVIVIGAPFLWVLLVIMNKLGSSWWFWGWSFMTLFQFAIIWAYPNYIAPLFNKFNSLEDNELKDRIEALLKKIDFSHNGIYVMDASKRSSHGNAYFTGFGKTKRIVFFDTLMKQLKASEVEAVLAHELGHFKHKHILKSMILSLVFSFIGFAVLGSMSQKIAFFNGHFITQQSSYMALFLFSLVIPLYTFFLTPVFSILSRKNEYEADSFAATHSNANDLINALVKLYKENASSLTPDPLYSKFYHSHPPALERINHLRKMQL